MNSRAQLQPGILDYFKKWETTIPHAVFLRQPEGSKWKEYSWKEVGESARQLASGIKRLGLEQGTRIAILSQNCAEWIICDLAILMGGCISVPLYANTNAASLKEILNHSESKLLFVGKLSQKEWDNLYPAIPASVITITMAGYEKESVIPWKNCIQFDNHSTEIISPSLDEILTIIYTSGTTGLPKGVMHSFGSIIKAIEACKDSVRLDKAGNRFFSYLPLSHAAERGLVEFGAIYSGGTISFMETQDSFRANIKSARPTHFFAVPRIWEKFQMKILNKVSQKWIDILLQIPLVTFLFRQYIKRTLGLQKAKIILSGAAPISKDLIIWFAQLGIRIQEAYGMSENFNVCSLNPKDKIRVGTVGKLNAYENVQIDPQTHEIIQKCEWIMKGYFKNPALTAATIRNGYLYTGDTGELTEDGYLKVSGRLKDIFKTSKGDYISPVETELHFLTLKEIDQACLLGQNYPQPFLIVVLSEFGKNIEREKLTKVLFSALDLCNHERMGYQKIKKVIIVREEWTIENCLLTPTLKMKRNELAAKYESQLKEVYYLDERLSFE